MSSETEMYDKARRLEASLLQLNMTDAAGVLHDLLELYAEQQSRREFYWYQTWEREFDGLRMEREQRASG